MFPFFDPVGGEAWNVSKSVPFGQTILRPSSFTGSLASKLNGPLTGTRSAGSRDSTCRTPGFGPRSFPLLLWIPT